MVRACCWLWLLFGSVPVWAQVTPVPAAAEGATYRKAWALVVGINYADRREDDANLTPLHNAEADAQAIATALQARFEGYTPDTVKVVLGAAATRAALEDLLGSSFLTAKQPIDGVNQPRIQADDSVVVFFSGHGNREPGDTSYEYVGYLYPYDVAFEAEGGIRTSTAIEYGRLLELLRRCRARHKLLIIDACYSGQIFKVEQRKQLTKAVEFDYFKTPALQVITAARAFEQASDLDSKAGQARRAEARAAHSPFVDVLLANWARPPGVEPQAAFAASLLFPILQREVPQRSVFRQEPVAGWLAGQGDFFFIPRGGPGVPKPHAGNFVLRTLPALHGVKPEGPLWFEEMPWLVPRIRVLLEEQQVDTVGSENVGPKASDVDRFYRDLRKRAQQAAYSLQRQDPELGAKLAQLASANSTRLTNVTNELATLLESRAKTPANMEAEDWHLLAVLQHRLARSEAEASFQAAVKAYSTADGKKKGLLTLCYADFSAWAVAQSDYPRALDLLEAAEAALQPDPLPIYFQVCQLSNEAALKRREGDWTGVNERLTRALKLVQEELPADHPLTAYANERMAWGLMEQWRVREASTYFQRGNEAHSQRATSDALAFVGLLHDQHGLAMANRLAGKTAVARKSYDELRERIIERLNNVPENWNESQIAALYERLFNSTERLGDTYLLVADKEPEKAARSYLQASGYVKHLGAGAHEIDQAALNLKSAIAFGLAGKYDEARAALAIAKLAPLTEKQKVTLQLKEALAEYLSTPPAEDTGPSEARLKAVVQTRREQAKKTDVPRDDREMLLLALQCLLRNRDRSRNPTVEADARTLVGMLPAAFDAEVSSYLRQYYDAAIEAAATTSKPDLPQLASWIRKAKTGDREYLLPREQPLLTFYFLADHGWALLWIPDGNSQLTRLPFGWLRLNQPNGEPLQLPPSLLTALVPIADTINVEWGDPVAGVTVEYPFAQPEKRRVVPLNLRR